MPLLALLLIADLAVAKPLTVVTTIPDLAAIATAVGGDAVKAESIGKGTQDPHFVDAKPSLLLKLSRADCLIEVGLDLETGWLPSLVRSARNARILPGQPGLVDASAGIRVLEKPEGTVSRTQGDVHPYGNPHYWLDPANGAVIARNIERGLAGVDGTHAEMFRKNREAFEAALAARMAGWVARMAPWKGTEVVAYHRSWIYFADRFGLVMREEIEPKPGIPPSPGHTLEIIRAIDQRRIPLIIEESFFDPAAAREIARRTGASLLELPSLVGGATGVTDTLTLFETLTRRIADTLAARRPSGSPS